MSKITFTFILLGYLFFIPFFYYACKEDKKRTEQCAYLMMGFGMVGIYRYYRECPNG